VAAALALVGSGVSLVVFRSVQHGEIRHAENDFHNRVSQQYWAVRGNLGLHDVVLHALASYVETTGDINQENFAAFVAPLVAEVPGIQALEWIPAVPAGDRAAFEQAAAAADFPGFSIVERDAADALSPAAGRGIFYPVRCAFPLESNRKALGFDLGSEPVRRAALMRAAETRQLSATAPVRLLQEQGAQNAWFSIMPVWGGQDAGGAPYRLRGYVLGVFRAGDVIANALQAVSDAPLPMEITDLDAGGPAHVFGDDVDELMARGGLSRDLEMSVGGRQWLVRFVSPRLEAASLASWLALAVSAILTWLVCAAFVMLARSRANAERMIAERTAELRESNERLRTVADLSTDFVYWRGVDGRLNYVSPAAHAVTGYHPTEFYAQPGLLDALVAPEDRERWQHRQKAARAGLALEPAEVAFVALDGSRRMLRHRSRPVMDQKHGLVGQRASLTDITEAKLSDESRDRERRLFIGGPVVVFRWRVGGDWPVEYVSPNVRNLLGVEPEELISGSVHYLDLIQPEDRQRALDNARRMADSGQASFQQSYRLFGRSGRTLHVLDFTVLVRDADGVVTHHEGYLQDVSEREEVRHQLEISKQQLDLAITGANLGLWDWNVVTGEVRFSDGFAAMLGYGPGELAPHVDTWKHLVHPDDLAQVMVVLQAHLEGATQQYETEHRLRHRDGHLIWVLDRGRVLERDGAGRALRAAGTHLDITDLRRVNERYQAGLALRERISQALARCTELEEIAEIAQSMMADAARFVGAAVSFIVRLDGSDESLRVINSWGAEPDAAGGAARVWMLSGRFSAWWPLTENLREPQLVDIKRVDLPSAMRGYLRDQGARSIVMMVIPVGSDVRYLVAFAARRLATAWEAPDAEFLRVLRDAFAFAQQRVELNRQNEQTRRQLVVALDRAEQANKVKITFLARMSHEIRTPMTAIVGLADVLRRSRTDLDEKTRAWLEQIQRNADHLIALLNDLLDLAKIDAGELQISNGPVPMHDVLDSVESTLLPRAQEKDLELSVTCDPQLPRMFMSDRLRLRQILLNLGTNAIKFTDRGRVDIEASLVGDGDPVLSLVVRDTGVGIAPDQLELIFQPFMQAPGEDLAARGGTGLGLDISRRLARALGGDIAVVSQPGLGSAFTLRMPLVPCDEGAEIVAHMNEVTAAPEITGGRLAQRRLLVVDDNPDNREVVSFYLKEAGATVETAVDGADGVRKVHEAIAAARPYEAVLMDMRMPVMNGYKATLSLRRAGVLTPVIALTAHAMEGDERACLNSGCNAYVSKPIEPLTLIATVAAQLSPAAAAEPEIAMPKPGGMLSGLAGDARFLPLLLRYLEGLPEQVEALGAARRAGDDKAVLELVHRLHGTGTSFGYPQISEVAGACERELRQGGDPAQMAGLDALEKLLVAAAASRDAIATIGGQT
jgi:PAS domain S-box-containing protein